MYGIVQGVGFRPAVARHAMRCGIRGYVCNYGSFVEIIAQADEKQADTFIQAVCTEPPERAEIIRTQVETLSSSENAPLSSCADIPIFEDFSITESTPAGGEIFIPPDIAICDDCRRELYDQKDRRYLHPFINCTQCGPRLTILESLPYDRERTSMKEFPMCPACDEEYHDPKSRRYDAQPVCCSDCGPEVYILPVPDKNIPRLTGSEAISFARKLLCEGGIVAVKGIGGFHLACNAADEQAVRRLRELKHRPVKPFAVMMKDMETVRRECRIDAVHEHYLNDHRKPILLLDRSASGLLAGSIAPGNPSVGVMLPYAPLQLLLFDYPDGITMPDMLVMTSGNISGAPICRNDEEALAQIGSFCDAILSHNRTIRTRADDSVMDLFDGRPYMIRRSRGYSPLPVSVEAGFSGRVLAMGGELKNTFCIGIDDLFYPSSYIGDLADRRSVRALKETIERYRGFLNLENLQAVACDLHPAYHSVQLASAYGLPVIQVQHHYAHILSCMAENGRTEPVLGASFDGTGYGTDGTIWGGEILYADTKGFRRLGHICSFPHTGGDLASREGWRIAVSMLHHYGQQNETTFSGPGADHENDPAHQTSRLRTDADETVKTLSTEDVLQTAEALQLAEKSQLKAQISATSAGLNTVSSTSAGRLFDAVSAVLGICRASTFEGEASCALEFAARKWAGKVFCDPESAAEERTGEISCSAESAAEERTGKDLPECRILPDEQLIRSASSEEGETENILILSTDLLFNEIVRRRMQKEDVHFLAYAFHACLSDMICAALLAASAQTGIRTAALSGGVFQNRLLLTLTV
ncbi:MAG: carbamoyltransferase HypF, partial [Eubacterium sp.]|nr:carbamoyltransferase HypF [Eubacterium sp.]